MRSKTFFFFLSLLVTSIFTTRVQSMKRSADEACGNEEEYSTSGLLAAHGPSLSVPPSKPAENPDLEGWLAKKRSEVFKAFGPYVSLSKIESETEQQEAMALMGEIASEHLPLVLKGFKNQLTHDDEYFQAQFPAATHCVHLKREQGKFTETVDRWGTQSWEDAVLGWVFYPPSLRKNPEKASSFYDQPGVLYQLATAAAFQNPEAWAHLGKFAESYLDPSPQKRARKMQKETSLEKLFSRSQEIVESMIECSSSPNILRGMAAYLFKNDAQRAKEFLSAHIEGEAVDPRQSYYLAIIKNKGDPSSAEVRALLHESADAGYMPAKFLLAQLKEDPVERLQEVYSLGEEGYFPAFTHVLEWSKSSNPRIKDYIKTLDLKKIKRKLGQHGYNDPTEVVKKSRAMTPHRSMETAMQDAQTILNLEIALASQKEERVALSAPQSSKKKAHGSAKKPSSARKQRVSAGGKSPHKHANGRGYKKKKASKQSRDE